MYKKLQVKRYYGYRWYACVRVTRHMLHWQSSCCQTECNERAPHGLPRLANTLHTQYPTVCMTHRYGYVLRISVLNIFNWKIFFQHSEAEVSLQVPTEPKRNTHTERARPPPTHTARETPTHTERERPPHTHRARETQSTTPPTEHSPPPEHYPPTHTQSEDPRAKTARPAHCPT